jgi:flavin reductase (DIM6/NTAB) family NADH-FMN oxidoreductase RutF
MTSPNPHWKPGDKIAPPFRDLATVDPAQVSQQEMYKLLIGAVVPRPIAFVSTIGQDGSTNLAPFSFFNAVASNPPCLMISIAQKGSGEIKDTLRNIQETKQFVVNSANEWLIEPLVHCAATYPYGVSEFEKVGLTAQPSVKVKPPRVKEAAVQFECELYKTLEIGEGAPGSTVVVFGRVVLAHIDQQAYKNGRVDYSRIRSIARLGGSSYAKVKDLFEIPVPPAGAE